MRSVTLFIFLMPLAWFGIFLLRGPAAEGTDRPDHDDIVRKNIHIIESKLDEAKAGGGQLNADQVRLLVHDLAWGCEHRVVAWTPEVRPVGDDGGWELECRPNIPATYAQSFVPRLLTADFSMHRWPTFRVSSKGEHAETPPADVKPQTWAGRAGVALVICLIYWAGAYVLLVKFARHEDEESRGPLIVDGFGESPSRPADKPGNPGTPR
jgi:hypothetical protein